MADDVYIVLFLNELGAASWLVGASAAVGCISNIPFFLVSPRLIKRIGPAWMVVVGMATFCLRAYLYTLLNSHNYRLVLLIQALHGLNFSVWLFLA